jgi:hypothetical protein
MGRVVVHFLTTALVRNSQIFLHQNKRSVINPHSYSHLIFDNDTQNTMMEKRQPLQMLLGKLDEKTHVLHPIQISIQKMHQKQYYKA